MARAHNTIARRNGLALSLSNGSAFTLMELLVTMALLAIMLYMLATAFAAAQAAVTETSSAVDAAQNARAALDLMRDELSSAKLLKLGGATRRLFEGVQNGDLDRLNFTTDAFQPARSKAGAAGLSIPQIVEVRYFLSKGKNNYVLMKQVDWDNDLTKDTADPPEGVAFNVKKLNFRYFEKRPDVGIPRWTPDGVWPRTPETPERLPAAVEIALEIEWLGARGVIQNAIFTEIVYLPESEVE